MSEWLAQRSFGEILCLFACLAICGAVLIGAIRGTSE